MSERGAEAKAGAAEAWRVVRNTSLQVIADVIGKLAMLVMFAVMARELGASGFGAFTFGISAVILIELAGVGVDVALARESARHPATAPGLVWNSLALKLAIGIGGGLIVAVIAALGDYSAEVRRMLAVIAVGKFLEMGAYSMFAVFRGLEDARPVAIGLIIQRLTMSIASIIGLAALGFGVVAVAGVYAATSLLALAYGTTRLDRRIGLLPPRASLQTAIGLLKTSMAIGIGSVFGAFLARADAVILSLYDTTAVVGSYGAAYRLFEGTLFVSYAFGIAVLPLIARLGPSSSPVGRVVEVAFKAISLVLFPIGLGITLFADPVVNAIFGSGLDGAISPARWLGVVVALYGIFILGVYVLAGRERQRPLPWLMAAAALVNVGLNLVLIPAYAANGAAAAMAITQVATTTVILVLAARAVAGLSLSRAFLGPSCGAIAMTAAGLALGESVGGLVGSLAVFALVAGLIEYRLFGDDFRFGVRVLLSRPAAGVEPAPIEP